MTLFEYCKQNNGMLLEQWHPEKNEDLTPHAVTHGSKRKVWWCCEKSHEWQATVKSRVEGAGCPVCANRTVQKGVNDLATTHPELAKQWHPTKNGSLTPEMVTFGTIKKVWWRCEADHVWEARVDSRVLGNGCPVCANKVIVPGVNDLFTFYPLLAAQWDREKNGALRPDQVSPYSNRRVWWRCELGHEWHCVIAHRTMNGSDCPYCTGRSVLTGFNDLQTLIPEIARDWHPALNGALTPELVTAGSAKKVWWQCAYGHVWKASIASRTGQRKHGCPACAGKVKYAKQRYYEAIEQESAAVKLLAAQSVWATDEI